MEFWNNIGPKHFLVASAFLFSIGIVIIMVRRQFLFFSMGIVLIFNSVLLSFMVFSRGKNIPSSMAFIALWILIAFFSTATLYNLAKYHPSLRKLEGMKN